MSSLNITLEIAKNTLLNSQALIQTTSHNITNADNTNYARQKVVTSTAPPVFATYGWLGNGARVTVVQQQRDELLERQLLDGSSDASKYKTLSTQLNTIQTYLADDGVNGLSKTLEDFWNAWDSLNQNSGDAEKSLVYTSAKNLASSIVETHQNLTDQIKSLTENAGDTVSQINSLLDKISALNEEIAKSESPTIKANDLRDSRYAALKDLSNLISFQYDEDADTGAVSIYLDRSDKTNTTLVSASPANVSKLAFNENADGTFTIETAQGKNLASYQSVPPSTDPEVAYGMDFSGSLRGVLDALKDADSYDGQLTTFKDALIERVNNTYDTTESWPTSPAPVPSPWVFSDANYMEVDGDFTASSVDATRSLVMANLQDNGAPALGDMTFSDYLKNLQQQIGLDQNHAASQASFKEALTQQLQQQQQSTSGVSIDEEMIDMLKNQQLYQAAAKMVQKTSELLDTAIQMVQ